MDEQTKSEIETTENDAKIITEESNDTKNSQKNIQETYKTLVQSLKTMDEWYDMLKKTTIEEVTNHLCLKESVLDDIIIYEKDSIKDMPIQELAKFLVEHSIQDLTKEIDDSTENDVDYVKILSEGFSDVIKDAVVLKNEQSTFDQLIIDFMIQIKDASLILLSSKKEIDSIRADSEDIFKEYYEYQSSDKIRKSRMKQLEMLEQSLEKETRPYEKRAIQKMVDTLRSAIDFSFVTERFEKYDWETKNIMEGFFSMKKGSYIIDRFKSHITHYGYNENVHKLFFNLEEKFLPEEYHIYNNLFLFIYMRRVGYSDFNDKYDTMLVQSFTGALANLIYHRFSNTDSEQEFIDVIIKTLDYFKEYADKFENENTTYKNHPTRVEFEKQHEQKRWDMLVEKCKNIKISQEEIDNCQNADVLQQMYNEAIDKMATEQIEKEKGKEDNLLLDIPESEVLTDINELGTSIDEALDTLEEIPEEEFENPTE